MASQKTLFGFGLLLLAAASIEGCEGDTADLFSNSDGTTSNGTSAAPSTGATTGAATSGGFGGMGGAPNTGTTTGATVSSSAGQGPASSSAASTTGSGMTGSDVTCNNQPCAQNQVCCYSNIAPTDHCSPKGTCGIDAELACDGPDDCPGAKCCGKKNGSAWEYTVCDSQCGGGEIVMCANAPNTCAANQVCKPIPEIGQAWFGCFNN